MSKVEVYYEATPNPQAMKFVLTEQIANETAYFDDPQKAQRSPLATKLFGFPWASAIMVGPNFVTVTKQDWVEWQILADPLSSLIAEHIDRNEGVLLNASDVPEDQANRGILSDDSLIVKEIKRILNTEIRPAVAMDGGDIEFANYADGVLSIHMKGACSGCPSSTMTLKQGIETRMREALPEIKEVISI
ncbi:MAG: NifU family protein [Bdellovibrionota bacterium]